VKRLRVAGRAELDKYARIIKAAEIKLD